MLNTSSKERRASSAKQWMRVLILAALMLGLIQPLQQVQQNLILLPNTSSSQLNLSCSASDVDSEGPPEPYLYDPLESNSSLELEGAESEDDDSS